MKTKYIQYRYKGETETIDEFPYNTREERKEFNRVLQEYRISMPEAFIYPSTRPCKNWNS